MILSFKRLLYLIGVIILSLPFCASVTIFIDLFSFEVKIGPYDPSNINYNPDAYLGIFILGTIFLSFLFLIFMAIAVFSIKEKTVSYIFLIITISEVVMGILLTHFHRRDYFNSVEPWYILAGIFAILFCIAYFLNDDEDNF